MAKITSKTEFVRSPIAPFTKKSDDWRDTAYRWSVTLIIGDRELTTDFYTGSGRPNAPETHEVVNCLAMDWSSIETHSDFESWAREYSLDEDSREAEVMYEKLKDLSEDFGKFINDEFDIHELCDEEEAKRHCFQPADWRKSA